VTVAASTLIGIFTVPVLVIAVGAQEWASIALAQTVGQLVTIFVAFGWGVTGPSMVAVAPAGERQGLYLQSLVSRCYTFVVGYVVAVVVLAALLRGDVTFALIGAAAYVVPALGASWFFVGSARPWLMFFCDALPTMLGTVLGMVLAGVTHSVELFLVGQLTGSALAVVIDAVVVLRQAKAKPDLRMKTTVRALGAQRHALFTGLTAGLYVNLPVIIVQAFAPGFLPTYVLADRLYKYGAVALSPFQQYLQGWVPEAGREHIRDRAIKATFAGLLLGVVGGCAVVLLSPFASWLLSGQRIQVPFSLSIPLGIAFLAVATSAVVGYACLALIGRVRSLAVSTFVGAVVGIPLAILCAALGWPTGVAWAVAVSELAVATYQLAVLWRWAQTRTVLE